MAILEKYGRDVLNILAEDLDSAYEIIVSLGTIQIINLPNRDKCATVMFTREMEVKNCVIVRFGSLKPENLLTSQYTYKKVLEVDEYLGQTIREELQVNISPNRSFGSRRSGNVL